MNISGVHANGITKVPDKISEVVQKEVESTTTEKSFLGTINTVTGTESITYEGQILKAADNNSKNDVVEAVTEENRWKNNSSQMSEEDYKDLSNEGISLEEYNLEQLDRALTRIKSQRIVKEENLEGQKEQIEEKFEAIKDMSNNGSTMKEIKQKLMEADMPVTEANIAKIANAMELAMTASQISDRSMNYLIKNKLEPTIENIYKAQYSGNYSQNQGVSEETWNGLIGQVKEIISNSGLEVNNENLDSAKWLLDHQLPLTEDNLWALRDLNQIKSGIGKEEVLDKAVEALMAGNTPESASLGVTKAERVEQTIAIFHNISEEAIDFAVQTKQEINKQATEINCRELQQAQRLVEAEDEVEVEIHNSLVQNKIPEDIDIRTITVRRQLEEIRLKMTVESGIQLTKKGFHLETDSLSKIIDGLKEIEDQYYSNLLQEGNAEVNTESLDTLKISLEGLKELKSMPSYILGSTLYNKRIETVSGLLAAGTECKQSLSKANEAYETLMTSPRADMGDSISKAFRNVNVILEDMKLETTKANERAVRILGYNQIEITEENIQQVKAYDEQVNHMMKNLHPAVTVELIKKGINPLNIPIEELNQQINEIKNELGVGEEEKYSKYLWKLEKEQGITEEEKKSYIGIYRLLNTVEKSDGAALGAVIKADQDVTLNNLLTAVRTKKSGGIHANVDDNLGMLDKVTFSRERITDQINAAFQSATQTDLTEQTEEMPSNLEDKFGYINSLLQNVMEEITPKKLQTLENTDDIMNMSVEKLQENLLIVPDNEESELAYWSQKVKTYQNTVDQADNALRLLNDYSIPSSIQNILAANDVLSTDQSIYKQVNNLLKKEKEQSAQKVEAETEQTQTDVATVSERLINSLTNQKSMKTEYESVEKDVNKLINQFYENPVITSQDITALQRISNGMSFLQKLATRESYEIPISVEGEVTNVNVTILRNKEETGKVDISINSETLGKVSMGFTVKEQGLKGLITCDNRFGLEAIESRSEELKEAIEQGGLELRQLNYGIDNKTIDSYRYKNPNITEETDSDKTQVENDVSTDTLYTLAKTLLIQIKTIEIDNAKEE